MIRIEDDRDEESFDSDSDLEDGEKELLSKVRSRRGALSDSEEEVLGVDVNSDEESDDSDIALSDVEGQAEEDDYMPDERAWGKDKRDYYSTDYVDPDYGGYQGKDAFLADLEEEEAKKLQKQLAEQLDDEDFTLDVSVAKADDKREEIVKTDISQLSKRQKRELLEKESPELFALIEDFGEKMGIAEEFLKPLVEMGGAGRIAESDALAFTRTYYNLILNYTNNITMYLLLKSRRVNVSNHPVIRRLYQYRQLINQMHSVFEEKVKGMIEDVLQGRTKLPKEVTSGRKTLKVLTMQENAKKRNMVDGVDPPKKRQKNEEKREPEVEIQVTGKKVSFADDESEDGSEDDKEGGEEQVEETEEEIGKRSITYQIAKNKGLTPHRKKEQRNPRVKHRNKFRKAKIRRKGAVREVRKELSRYGGELSGIKSTVTKSIKLKA